MKFVGDINRTVFWLFTMIFGAVLVWALVMSAHSAHAKGHDDGGTVLRPRGPGGPATMGDERGPWV